MRLIVVSGLSGSGKSVALHMFEDLDFYCIDNLPAALLRTFISHSVGGNASFYKNIAIGIDARNPDSDIATVPALLDDLKRSGINCELIYLMATEEELLRRFAETRRKHPLSRHGESLQKLIATERRLLEPVLNAADLVVDTTRLSVHKLRHLIERRIGKRPRDQLSVQIESFGFKHGIPGDADFVFDARTLPNPYWEPSLRELTGLDDAVIRFLEAQPEIDQFVNDVLKFITARLPEHEAARRRYMTVAIGCTGGQHRSVYIAEKLGRLLAPSWPRLAIRHTSLADVPDAKIAHNAS